MRRARPTSATQRAVEDRVFALQAHTDEEEEEEEDGAWGGEEEEEEGDLDNYLQYDDEDFGVSIL